MHLAAGQVKRMQECATDEKKRQTLHRATLFLRCSSRARLPEGDSLGLLPAINVNCPEGGRVAKERITCQCPSADGSNVLFTSHFARKRGKQTRVRKKGMQSVTESSGDRTRYREHCRTATRERSYHVSVLRGTPLG